MERTGKAVSVSKIKRGHRVGKGEMMQIGLSTRSNENTRFAVVRETAQVKARDMRRSSRDRGFPVVGRRKPRQRESSVPSSRRRIAKPSSFPSASRSKEPLVIDSDPARLPNASRTDVVYPKLGRIGIEGKIKLPGLEISPGETCHRKAVGLHEEQSVCKRKVCLDVS